MAKTTKTTQPSAPTRAEKREAAKELIRELLRKSAYKAGELIDEAARIFTERFGGEDTENPNDVKGRIGSVLDVMKKENEVQFDGGVYASIEEKTEEKTEEKPAPKKRGRTKKTAETAVAPETAVEAKETATEEKPVKAKRTTKKTAKKEESQPLPPSPLQPVAPVAPITPEVAPEPIPEEKPEDKPAPKKRGRAKKTQTAEVKAEEKEPAPVAEKTEKAEETVTTEAVKAETKPEEKTEVKAEAISEVKTEEKTEKNELAIKPKAEIASKGTLMDMSFLFGDIRPVKKEAPKAEKTEKAEQPQKPQEKQQERPQTKAEERKEERPESKAEVKQESRPAQKPQPSRKAQEEKETKPAPARETQPRGNGRNAQKRATRALTPDEKLQEAFLARLHKLGGEYFEYYSIYLLERYSRMNGRRLEGLSVTGGDHDGGIDGEIELTDRLGFRETIYIQAKNWDPDKGDEKLWVVGETLLQQFIGACVCRQAKDGKQHCRGIFITTSRFTPEAKKLLSDTSDKFVGYDGNDLYETAKECGFGIVKKNGEYALDETLLSGTKAFFNMF